MRVNDLGVRLRVGKGSAYHDVGMPSARVEGTHFDRVATIFVDSRSGVCHHNTIAEQPPQINRPKDLYRAW
jgi:hypothetical protein